MQKYYYMINSNSANKLLEVINDAILDKKGLELVNLDLTNIINSVTGHFVICHANNSNHAKVIAESVERKTREILHDKPWIKEGYENAQWLLLDYSNVVVHVFQKEYREFYNLEELWADAVFKHFTEDGKLIAK